jgi:5-methylcytosine-specific restriction endonuclease McrA
MARSFALQFYRSKAWRRCRDAYYASQHGICERCGGAGVIVHHTIELTPENIGDPHVSLNWEHLEVLCIDCHNQEHDGAYGRDARYVVAVADGLKFDEDGDLVTVNR